jgi:hypothetical protein
MLDPDWRVLCRCRGTRLDINIARGQLLIAGLDRAEIRPLSDLRDAIACQRRGRAGGQLHLRLGDCAGDTAIIHCTGMAEARHLSSLLLAVRHALRQPQSLPPPVWSTDAALFSQLPGTW